MQHLALQNMLELERFRGLAAANDSAQTKVRERQRERTVPIPETITPVPGYPQKLIIFKMAASRYWQIRCWWGGRSHRRSARTESQRVALHAARLFYEELAARDHWTQPPQGMSPPPPPGPEAGAQARGRRAGLADPPDPRGDMPRFGRLAEQMMRDEMPAHGAANSVWGVGR